MVVAVAVDMVVTMGGHGGVVLFKLDVFVVVMLHESVNQNGTGQHEALHTWMIESSPSSSMDVTASSSVGGGP